MKRLALFFLLFAQVLVLSGCGATTAEPTATLQAAGPSSLEKLDGSQLSTAELEASIAAVMEQADVAGLSLAIINDAEIVYQQTFGYKDRTEGTRSDEQTLFAAASFSKPVFAYLVMLLVEEGLIDLDRPLHEYLDQPLYEYPGYAGLKDDPRYEQITARMALSHTTGLPNSRLFTQDGELVLLFPPGSRHSYSGEGILLLQMVVEQVTGQDLQTRAGEKVFQPLGMSRSSYTWQPEFDDNHASPHDIWSRPRGEKIQPADPDAAGSMVTTAGDYARFVVGLLSAEGQRRTTVAEMFQPQVPVDYKRMFGPEAWTATDENQDINLTWGLGWGLFDSPYGDAFFHTGNSFGWQNYTVTYREPGTGIVMLSNSDNFESVAEEIASLAIGDQHSPYEWLGYVPYDPTAARGTPPPDPLPVTVAPEILAAYAGSYDLQSLAQFEVRFEDDRLFLQSRDGQDWERLFAESETSFFVESQLDSRFVFLVEDAGTVTGMQLIFHGIPLPPAEKVE
jgi:CubicO group peptidase (beta-lactamase class C family)